MSSFRKHDSGSQGRKKAAEKVVKENQNKRSLEESGFDKVPKKWHLLTLCPTK